MSKICFWSSSDAARGCGYAGARAGHCASRQFGIDGVPKIPASLAETRGDTVVSKRQPRGLASHEARDADCDTVRGDAAASSGEDAGRRAAALIFLRTPSAAGGFIQTAVTTFFCKGYRRRGVVPVYRYDVATGNVTLLTDGKSRNLPGPWSSSGDQIAYMSTRRTSKDTDLG